MSKTRARATQARFEKHMCSGTGQCAGKSPHQVQASCLPNPFKCTCGLGCWDAPGLRAHQEKTGHGKLQEPERDQTLKKDAGKPPLELLSRAIVDVWQEWPAQEGYSRSALQIRLLDEVHAFADGVPANLPRAMACAARLLSPDNLYTALVRLADVLAYGAKKYSPDGWRAGMEWRRLCGAALRHAYQAFGPNPDDEETGLPHLAHFFCCCMFLEEYRITGNGTDDRWKGKKL